MSEEKDWKIYMTAARLSIVEARQFLHRIRDDAIYYGGDSAFVGDIEIYIDSLRSADDDLGEVQRQVFFLEEEIDRLREQE